MKIAVASGKGGTGKSTISTNLAYLLSSIYKNVCLLDCDVEEPNCHIFLKPFIHHTERVTVPVPEVDKEKCIKCGKCSEVCEYNALAFVKEKVIVFPELCHGCGSCLLICPASAISETGREVGIVETGVTNGLSFIHGKMRIGEAMAPPLIKAVKKTAGRIYEIPGMQFLKDGCNFQILDCPPGTSCPVIAAVHGADYVFMVTEPTPFGLYDLKLGVDVIRKMKIPFGIVLNRSCKSDYLIDEYAAAEGIEILTRIPDDRRIAECYSRGELIIKALPGYKEAFIPLIDVIRDQLLVS
jgi:MinD superfamily P-loop ATPase